MPRTRPPAFVVAGPTASGKHRAGMWIARRLGGEILVADSMKVYRGMDAGTAKPGPDDRAQVRHHLIDQVDPGEPFAVDRWLDAAAVALADLDARGVPAVFVGGTHLYLQALLRGVYTGPAPDPAQRRALEARAAAGAPLWDELAAVDPASAARLHRADLRRIIRALEVYAATGEPLSALQARETRPRLDRPYRGLAIARGRAELYARIDQRVDQMLAAGWVEEVRGILARGGFSATARRGIGYDRIAAALEAGTDPLAERDAICHATHQLARKQLNWIARFEELVPVDVTGLSREVALERVAAAVEARLAAPPDEPRGGRWLRGPLV